MITIRLIWGTETFEQEKYVAIRNQRLEYLGDIRDSLQRIEKGTYGIYIVGRLALNGWILSNGKIIV